MSEHMFPEPVASNPWKLNRAHCLVIGLLDDGGHLSVNADGTLGVLGNIYIEGDPLRQACAAEIEELGQVLVPLVAPAKRHLTTEAGAVADAVAALRLARRHHTSEALAAHKARAAYLTTSQSAIDDAPGCAFCGQEGDHRPLVVVVGGPTQRHLRFHSSCQWHWFHARGIVAELVVHRIQCSDIVPAAQGVPGLLEIEEQRRKRLGKPPGTRNRLETAIANRRNALHSLDLATWLEPSNLATAAKDFDR
jgi:hypothetical protein